MISQGKPARSAQAASKELLSFVNEQTIKPQNILTAELKKINHQLTAQSLELLQEHYNNPLNAKTSLNQKQRTMALGERLKEFFSSRQKDMANLLILLLTVSLSSLACGLKTNPKNSRLDYRPEVPSHKPIFEDLQPAVYDLPNGDKIDKNKPAN